jgi:carbon monoxide dehydrogenase subunit G
MQGEKTMITWEKNKFINRPPQEVWDFISDPANLAQWLSGADYAEWTSEGPPGVGSTLIEVGKVLGLKMESPVEITIWDPPNEFGRKSIGGPSPWESRMKLEPKENGTQLTISGEAEFRGILKPAEGLIAKQIENQGEVDFEALKQLLEAS